MLISFTRRFAHIKTHKTGGTSLEMALCCVCAPPDLRPPIYPPDEKLLAEMGGLAPTKTFRGHELGPHLRAKKIAEIIPEEWPDMFKFALERHPYEKAVSLAFWRMGRNDIAQSKFNEVLDEVIDKQRISDRKTYCIKGTIAVDKIYFHDKMDEAVADLSERLGVKLPDLPRAKGGFRHDRRPAAEILSADQKRRIQETMAWEFDKFGFQP